MTLSLLLLAPPSHHRSVHLATTPPPPPPPPPSLNAATDKLRSAASAAVQAVHLVRGLAAWHDSLLAASSPTLTANIYPPLGSPLHQCCNRLWRSAASCSCSSCSVPDRRELYSACCPATHTHTHTHTHTALTAARLSAPCYLHAWQNPVGLGINVTNPPKSCATSTPTLTRPCQSGWYPHEGFCCAYGAQDVGIQVVHHTQEWQ